MLLRGARRARLPRCSTAAVAAPALSHHSLPFSIPLPLGRAPSRGHQSQPSPGQAAPERKSSLPRAPPLPGVRHVVCVASGKGGVGKSTVSANLAVALSRLPRPGSDGQRLRVGLLDADIYGPSVPTVMGLAGVEAEAAQGETDTRGQPLLEPLTNFGVKCMSTGFLVDAEHALAWRGPMATSALDQLLRGTRWTPAQAGQKIDITSPDALDVMVIDLPPGTGDIQISMGQRVLVTGAVIVSTPQDLALADAKRAVALMHKVNIPVIGYIENMSGHVCSNCGHEDKVFGMGGVAREAEKKGEVLLGEIPLLTAIREHSDAGSPMAAVGGPVAERFSDIATKLWASLEESERTEKKA
jgi:ATP-binding protein involved in chromosome partitioning